MNLLIFILCSVAKVCCFPIILRQRLLKNGIQQKKPIDSLHLTENKNVEGDRLWK